MLCVYSDSIDFIKKNLIADKRLTADANSSKKKQAFGIYSNSANTIVHIQINGAAIITITGSNGKLLLIESISSKGDINVSAFASGTYYVQNKTTGEMQKLIVVH